MEEYRAHLAEWYARACEGDPEKLVYGEGGIGARLMLVGEAPGEQETLQRRPFVGKAGKNLDEFLALVGIDRGSLYVTNAVKFRPTRVSKAGRIVNRPPTQTEILRFLPWLEREIELVRPEVVVTLGNVPLQALCGRGVVIGEVHGLFLEINGRKLYPMYHPASMIYNRSLRDVWRADAEKLSQSLQTTKI